MTSVEGLLAVISAYREATGLAETTVSTRFLARGSRLAALAAGGDMGSRLVERTLRRLHEQWPADAVWPAGVPRPWPNADAARLEPEPIKGAA